MRVPPRARSSLLLQRGIIACSLIYPITAAKRLRSAAELTWAKSMLRCNNIAAFDHTQRF